MIEKTTAMTAKLVAEEGLLKELVLSFEEGEQWIIGRDPDACQLIIEDPAASRKHVSCKKSPLGITIENLSVTNPVYVNDEMIAEPKLLQQGDLVKIGDTLFRYYNEEEIHLEEDELPLFNEPAEITSELDSEEGTEETNIPEVNQAPFPTKIPPISNDSPHEEENDTIFDMNGSQNAGLTQINFDLMETGRWLLKVVGGPNNGAEFSMQSGSSYTIGTDPNSCDIVFYDNSVSRQHARITISQDDQLAIEDLRSRNGTRLDGELITSSRHLPFNTFVTMGTTSFVVYDREGEMQTIMSPLLPSIVKVLQKEESPEEKTPSIGKESTPSTVDGTQTPPVTAEKKATIAPSSHLGALMVTAFLIGLFAIVGVALQSLLLQEPVAIEQTINPEEILTQTLTSFPEVKSSFNKSTGRLLLVGHVLTATDKNQLLNSLQGMKFIKDIDESGLIIDEYIWSEANQILSKNPFWKGITVHSTVPGQFVLSGYLQSRDQAQQVWDYMTRNFSSLDQLDNKIIVEEDILGLVNASLREQGITNVISQMSNGELTLTGVIPSSKKAAYQKTLKEFQEIRGLRSVRNLVTEQAVSESVINISDRYVITGVSRADNKRLNVVINGRILAEGDILDGMKITNIQNNAVYLERDGIKYRIDNTR